jgi:hypothetical protein
MTGGNVSIPKKKLSCQKGKTSSSRSNAGAAWQYRHGPLLHPAVFFCFLSVSMDFDRTGFFKNVHQYFFMTADPD